jgi:hypothetical protein
LDTGLVAATMADKFWGNVQRGDPCECWLWTGDIWEEGGQRCGQFTVHRRNIAAHEFSSIVQRGLIPEVIVRQCDKDPLCVNPRHLALDPLVLPDPWSRKSRRQSKTHCENGHPRTPTNTHVSRTGLKYCWVCYTEREEKLQASGAIQC